jgi:hypothetical protein
MQLGFFHFEIKDILERFLGRFCRKLVFSRDQIGEAARRYSSSVTAK